MLNFNRIQVITLNFSALLKTFFHFFSYLKKYKNKFCSCFFWLAVPEIKLFWSHLEKKKKMYISQIKVAKTIIKVSVNISWITKNKLSIAGISFFKWLAWKIFFFNTPVQFPRYETYNMYSCTLESCPIFRSKFLFCQTKIWSK